MKAILPGLILVLALAHQARAHPGIGIVMDSRGNVFYTDLHHVWRISESGEKTIVVENVHTHELCLDSADNLYGEHLAYEGEEIDRWNHRVWRLCADGTLTDIIPTTEGFLTNYSFVRDAKGTMYWAERGATTIFRKRLADGTIAEHARATPRDLRWMMSTPEGTIYFVDTFSLCEIKPDGSVRTVVEDLREERSTLSQLLGDRHHVMGLWSDEANDIYAAVAGSRCVKRVTSDGDVTIVARSEVPWVPTGGLVAPDDALWILECGRENKVRVRRIASDGMEKIFE